MARSSGSWRTAHAVRNVLRRFGRTADKESVALLVSAVFFAIGFTVTFVMFWGTRPPITGPDSVGRTAAFGSAVVAAIALVMGRLFVRSHDLGRDHRDALALPDDRLRWYDRVAITAAYSAVALLGWQGIAVLAAQSFRGAPVYPFPAGVLVGVAFALTAYIVFLSGVALSPTVLSIVLAIFLVVGAFASMLQATNPHWWRLNLSALGLTTNQSSWIFNSTLIIAGVITTTIARYATAHLPAVGAGERRGRWIVRHGLVLLGILLAGVGATPFDLVAVLHVVVSASMVLVFTAIIVALPWLLPTLPRVFYTLGYIFVAIIVLLGVYYATEYYNLTAVELVAAILVFTWIIIFLRVTSVSDDPAALASGLAPVAEEAARDHERDDRDEHGPDDDVGGENKGVHGGS